MHGLAIALLAGLSPLAPDTVAQASPEPDLLGPPPVFETTHLRAAPIPWVSVPVLGVRAEPDTAEADGQRPKAIEYSDAYHVRLKIHQIGSYLELPLFAGELIVGQKLANNRNQGIPSSDGLRNTHRALASGLGVLFAVNTVTGLWNLWEGRRDPAGRTRRLIHAVGMLLADAGFLATASAAPDDDFDENFIGNPVNRHRNLAIASVSVATLSTAMMWLWKD